jgi:hypothetical protein
MLESADFGHLDDDGAVPVRELGGARTTRRANDCGGQQLISRNPCCLESSLATVRDRHKVDTQALVVGLQAMGEGGAHLGSSQRALELVWCQQDRWVR